jgi:lipase chaperone LimK
MTKKEMKLERELQSAIEEIAALNADLERQRAVWQEHFDHMAMRIAEARNAALEEAAEAAAQWKWPVSNLMVINAIRALKDKPNG